MKTSATPRGFFLSFTPYFACVCIGAGFWFCLPSSHAQELSTANPGDVSNLSAFDTNLKALEATTPAPAAALPEGGLFYSAKHANWPPFPANICGLDAWPLDTNVFVLDDLNFSAATRTAKTGSIMEMDDSGPPSPGGGGSSNGTNSDGDVGSITNDPRGLWLQITGKTNSLASLVIHPGTTNANNGTYDLLYCTNLLAPISWQWIMRTPPGQTNLAVANATNQQGFYRVGLPNDLAANDSLGTNFWVMFPRFSGNGNNPTYLSLYISSPVGATGTVTGQIPDEGDYIFFTNTFSVAAGVVTNMSILNQAMIGEPDQVGHFGIHVTASQPVSVYGMDFNGTASFAFTFYPTPLLGTNYCIMARASMDTGDLGNSEFGVVATADNTSIWTTPSTNANLVKFINGTNGIYPTNTYTKTLTNQGDAYLIYANDFANDVTGTRIASDKPVGVFAGADVADVPNGFGAANPLIQEQLPVDSWGTQALSLSFASRTNGDSYRVLAANNNTVVTISGTIVITNSSGQFAGTSNGVVVTNQAGQFYDIMMEGPVVFQGSQPIQVAHFANGTTWDGREGDPCEILLPPTGYYLETNVVFILTNDFPNNVIGDFDENFLTIIAAQSATNSTYVDTTNKITDYVAIGSSGYYGAQFTVTNSGAHKVTSSQPVGVGVYGWGDKDVYGYFGGVVK